MPSRLRICKVNEYGSFRGALHQYRRVIARVSSSVRAGLCPARGRIRPANTAVPVGRCTHIRASRRRPLPPGLCWCRQRGRTAAVRTEENRLRIGKITIGSLGDWTPTPDRSPPGTRPPRRPRRCAKRRPVPFRSATCRASICAIITSGPRRDSIFPVKSSLPVTCRAVAISRR